MAGVQHSPAALGMAPGVVANQSEWSPFPAGPSRAAAVREGCHGDSPPGASAGPAGASGDGAESSTFHFTSREGWVRGRTSSWLSPAGSPVRAPRMEEEVTYADLQIPPPAATAALQHLFQLSWRGAALGLSALCTLFLLCQVLLISLSLHLVGQMGSCGECTRSTEDGPAGGQAPGKLLAGQCQFCPAGWLWEAGSCFYFSTTKRTWEGSREDCTGRDAQLAAARPGVILANLQQVANTSVFYIGLKEDNPHSGWKFLDGSMLDRQWVKRKSSSYPVCGKLSGSGLSGGQCWESQRWICEQSAAVLQWGPGIVPPTLHRGSVTYVCAGPL
ncbi:killer cell lectin-like receptor subfamily G member 1 [Alligator mississippiensis]|nr:killer cell lectin-like receptor subfamily G member 1 [Alligator mississippiensis]